MDKIIRGPRIRLEILPPLPEYVNQLVNLVNQNNEHLDKWRGDVLKYETPELAFYKLLMDNYHYERKDGYFYHIMKGQKIIGQVSLLSSGRFWELAYWLDKDHVEKGFMREALGILEKHWFQNKTDALTVLVKPQNSASLNVVHKMGYVLCGQNRYLKNFAMFMEQYRSENTPKCVVSGQKQVESIKDANVKTIQ